MATPAWLNTELGNKRRYSQDEEDGEAIPPSNQDTTPPSSQDGIFQTPPQQQQGVDNTPKTNNVSHTALGDCSVMAIPAWLKTELGNKRRYSQIIEKEFDAVARLLKLESTTKKAKRMSRLMVDPVSKHQYVEIVEPMADKERKDVPVDDFHVGIVDLGTPSVQGDIHNATVEILATRLEEREKEKEILEDQVNILTSYIKSIVEVIDQINKYKFLGKAVEEWVKKLIVDGLLFIHDTILLYTKISSKQTEILSDLKVIKKEEAMLNVAKNGLTTMVKLDTSVLIAEQVIDKPKENESVKWLNAVEWKLSMVKQCLNDLKNLAKNNRSYLLDLRTACISLGVDIYDETESNLLDVVVIKQAFKDLLVEELKIKEDVTGNSMERLNNVAAYLMNFKKDVLEM